VPGSEALIAHGWHRITLDAVQLVLSFAGTSCPSVTFMARVLIVDDSPSQLIGLKRIMEKLGHAVITAEDGVTGVEAARRELPDLILMDVVMPNLNGFQATRSIAKDPATAHIPVILVTTKDQATDRLWGLRQGARAYVTKPINEAELGEALREVLGG
jgi:twitching motility two-component system response regulator PilH